MYRPMKQITIDLWRNDEELDWSAEINGLRHEHITSEIMEDLVECALIVAERTLTEASTHLGIVPVRSRPVMEGINNGRQREPIPSGSAWRCPEPSRGRRSQLVVMRRGQSPRGGSSPSEVKV